MTDSRSWKVEDLRYRKESSPEGRGKVLVIITRLRKVSEFREKEGRVGGCVGPFKWVKIPEYANTTRVYLLGSIMGVKL